MAKATGGTGQTKLHHQECIITLQTLCTVGHTTLHPSCWYNNFAKLCNVVIIFGTSACLIFFVKLKTEPAFQI